MVCTFLLLTHFVSGLRFEPTTAKDVVLGDDRLAKVESGVNVWSVEESHVHWDRFRAASRVSAFCTAKVGSATDKMLLLIDLKMRNMKLQREEKLTKLAKKTSPKTVNKYISGRFYFSSLIRKEIFLWPIGVVSKRLFKCQVVSGKYLVTLINSR